jgi:hypothetical protein
VSFTKYIERVDYVNVPSRRCEGVGLGFVNEKKLERVRVAWLSHSGNCVG